MCFNAFLKDYTLKEEGNASQITQNWSAYATQPVTNTFLEGFQSMYKIAVKRQVDYINSKAA